MAHAQITDNAGEPLVFTPHDFRRIFATEAIMNWMPPHIAQLVLGHKDITTTMGYKAVYPDEAITAHRAFIARRRDLRPAEEYRTPTEAEWEEFLGHFQRRKVELGDCGRAYGTACHHEHCLFSELRGQRCSSGGCSATTADCHHVRKVQFGWSVESGHGSSATESGHTALNRSPSSSSLLLVTPTSADLPACTHPP